MTRIGAVGLRPLLPSPQRPRIGRLTNMSVEPRPAELLDHEQPAGRALQRDRAIDAVEPGQPLPEAAAGRGSDLAPPLLTAVDVDVVVRDLATMHIKPTYDAHGTSFSSCMRVQR